MKRLFVILFLISTAASANTVVLSSQNSDSELACLPQQLMATFVDQGFIQIQSSKNIWDLTLNNLRCDYRSNDALYPDYYNGGLPSVKCSVNNTPVQESRYIYSMITLIEAKAGGEFTDCAMGGKCTSIISSIKCRIDMNQEEMFKAYSCELK